MVSPCQRNNRDPTHTTVDETEWNRILILASLMYIVHVELPESLNLDVPGELGKFVDSSLAGTPVKAALLVFK